MIGTHVAIECQPTVTKDSQTQLTIQHSENDICPPSDVSDCGRGDVYNDEVADPVACCRDGGTALTELQGKNLGRVHPYSGLKADGEGTLEDEKHCCCTNSCGVGYRCVMLNLIDQSSLDSHDGSHETDHGQEQRSPPKPVDQKPRDERGDEEPGVQEAGHETRKMTIKSETLGEERGGVVDQGVDTTKLLESLDAAGNQEATLALNIVIPQQV